MDIVLRYFTELGSFRGQLHHSGWTHTVCDKNVPKESSFWQRMIYFMVIISEITEKKCIKERYTHSTVKILIMQHCTQQ